MQPHSILAHLDDQTRHRCYRISFLGHREGGKTTFLAALGLQGASRGGLAVTGSPTLPNVPVPPGDRGTWDLGSDPVKAFYYGSHKLEEARRALTRGEQEGYTQANAPLLSLFHVSDTAQERRFSVEMMDYAGELLRRDQANNALTIGLRRHLKEMDGILVAVEAGPDEPGEAVDQVLTELSEAFHAVPTERVPVALLLMKWDLLGKKDASPEEREREVDEFLSRPGSPYGKVRDEIVTKVGAENFKAFASSAFGEARNLAAEGKPPRYVAAHPSRLGSYGLMEPLKWVADRRDALDLESIDQSRPATGWPSRLNLFAPAAAFRHASKANRLHGRLSDKSPHRSMLEQEQGLGRSIGIWRSTTLALAMMVLLVPLGVSGWTAWAASQRQAGEARNAAVIKRVKEEADRLLALEVPDRSKLTAALESARALPPDKGHATPQNLHDIETLVTRINAVLTKLGQRDENSQHEENRAHLRRIASELEGAANIKALSALLERLSKSPHPDMRAHPVFAKEHQKLEETISTRISQLAAAEDWGQFKERFDQAMKKEELVRAAGLLQSRKQRRSGPEIEALVDAFPAKATQVIDHRCKSDGDQKQFSELIKWLKRLEQNEDVRSLLGEGGRKTLAATLDRQRAEYGKHYWTNTVQKNPTEANLQNYETLDCDHRMKSEIGQFRDNRKRHASKSDLALTVAGVDWGNWWPKHKARVEIYVNGESVADNVISTRAEGVVAEGPFSAPANEQMVITVYVTTGLRNHWWRMGGQTEPVSLTPEDLREGKTLDLSVPYDNFELPKECSVTLKVNKLPPVYKLPDWRD